MRNRISVVATACWVPGIRYFPLLSAHLPMAWRPGAPRLYSRSLSSSKTDGSTKPMGFFQSFFEKPNLFLRSRVPISEEDLQKLGKRPVLESAQYYSRFRFAAVDKERFSLVPDLVKKLTKGLQRDAKITFDPNSGHEIGDLVEAYSNEGELLFGTVIEPLQAKFDDKLNHVKIFTIDGRFVQVRPFSVTLHLKGFFQADVVQEILSHHDRSSLLQQVQYSMILFVNYCVEVDQVLQSEDLYSSLYLSLSSNSSSRFISTEKLYLSLASIVQKTRSVPPLLKRLLIQYALLFLAHYHPVNTPCKYWINNPMTNFNPNSHNNFNSGAQTFSVPRFLSETVTKVTKMDTSDVMKFRDFVLYMYKDSEKSNLMGPNVKNLLYYQKNNFQTIFRFLKYYVKYPHPILETQVVKLLGHTSKADPKVIVEFLTGLRIFDRDLTDLLLSSELFGHDRTSLSVAETGQILPKDDYNSISFTETLPLRGKEILYEDNFLHLRTELTLDKVGLDVFGIPTLESGGLESEICFSILKKNSRDWVLNIHVPDIGSFISPTSSDLLFLRMLKRPHANDVKLPNGDFKFLPPGIKHHLSFKNETSRHNCITISFPYNRRDPEKSWTNLKPTVKLDVIKDITVLNGTEFDLASGNIGPLSFAGPIRDIDFSSLRDFLLLLISRMKYRTFNGAIESGFPRNVIKVNPKKGSDQSVSNSITLESVQPDLNSKLIDEIHLLVDSLMGIYCENAKLPIYYHTQSFQPSSTPLLPLDISFIHVLASYMPQLVTPKIQDLLMQRRFSGTLIPSLYLCALEFLNNEKISTEAPDCKEHKFYAVDHSLVKFSKPLQSLELLVNQWQLLKHLHSLQPNNSIHNSTLALNGYLVDEMELVARTKPGRPKMTLSRFYKNVIQEKQIAMQSLAKRSKKQWAIRWLKQTYGIQPREYQEKVGQLSTTFESDYFPELTKEWFFFMKCVILRSESSPRLASLYCMDLGVEVEVLLLPGSNVSIGDRLVCTSIVYLNELDEKLILQL